MPGTLIMILATVCAWWAIRRAVQWIAAYRMPHYPDRFGVGRKTTGGKQCE